MGFQTLDDLNRFRANQQAITDAADYVIARGLDLPSSEWPTAFRKAAVAAMNTVDQSALAQQLRAFKNYVLSRSVLEQLPALRVEPLIPIPSETTDAGTAYWHVEGEPIPTTIIGFVNEMLTARSLTAMIAITRTLAQRGGPTAHNAILRLSRRKLVRGLDTAMLGATAASTAQPAGLLNGVVGLAGGSPVSGSSIEELIAVVSDGAPAVPVFICSPRAAAYLATLPGNAFKDVKLKGGEILGAPLIISPAAGPNLILVDAEQVATHNGELDIEASGQADLQMSDSPTNGAAEMVSMYQTNTVAVRFVHTVSWARLADDAVGYLELGAIGTSPA